MIAVASLVFGWSVLHALLFVVILRVGALALVAWFGRTQ
jgi:hypothetical protein